MLRESCHREVVNRAGDTSEAAPGSDRHIRQVLRMLRRWLAQRQRRLETRRQWRSGGAARLHTGTHTQASNFTEASHVTSFPATPAERDENRKVVGFHDFRSYAVQLYRDAGPLTPRQTQVCAVYWR